MSGAPPNQRTPPRILPRTAEPCRRAEGIPSRTRPRHASRRSPPAPRRAALLPTTAAAADRLSPPSARLGRATRRRKCRSAVLGEAERQLPRSPPARGASRARELRGARERPPARAERSAATTTTTPRPVGQSATRGEARRARRGGARRGARARRRRRVENYEISAARAKRRAVPNRRDGARVSTRGARALLACTWLVVIGARASEAARNRGCGARARRRVRT